MGAVMGTDTHAASRRRVYSCSLSPRLAETVEHAAPAGLNTTAGRLPRAVINTGKADVDRIVALRNTLYQLPTMHPHKVHGPVPVARRTYATSNIKALLRMGDEAW